MQMPVQQQHQMQMPVQQQHQMQMPVQQQHQMQMPVQMQQQPHPTVLATFLSLDPIAQKKFAMANPVAFAQLSAAAKSIAPDTSDVEEDPPVRVKSKTKMTKHRPSKHHVQSESDNMHSSDEELNIKVTTPVKETFLQIDFRNNIRDVTVNGVCVLSIPPMKIQSIELVTCILNRSPLLDKEPYIYISIDEIPGEYKVMGESNKITSVFGKLTPEKTVNEFIFYTTENCKKTFSQPLNLDQLTVTFLQYDHTAISLGKISVRDLSTAKSYYRLNTRGAHYMSSGDSINITRKGVNRIMVESVMVIETPTPDTIITECPSTEIGPDDRCTFEKCQIKCSLTFKIKY